jgi:signal transduction histidine kinase
MKLLRSVGARLSLALAFVVLVALGIVYVVIVPPLERNLIDSKLGQMTRDGEIARASVPDDFSNRFIRRTRAVQAETDAFLQTASDVTSARVALFEPAVGTPVVAGDSSGAPKELVSDPIVLRTMATGQTERGTIVRNGQRFAEVALPVVSSFDLPVLLLSSPLDETLANVELVKRRVLLAGGAALLFSLVAGYGGAWIFARRLRRLERAAERIAGGEFDEPVVDNGSDEVGELARAFERMRGRLAQLEHARREFIANASHELRTPIFSLGGFLELLDDEDLDDDTRREFVATMHEQLERLTRLATDLLDLSRLDAGRLHVERTPVVLADVASELSTEFAAVARSTGHPLSVELGEDAPTALADEQRVLRIGRVLVENALRHTPPGTTVTIRADIVGDEAELSVEDDGPGIPPEHLPHVFERFYRVDGGRASGSGLGLAIARELATVMSGDVTAESHAGRTVCRLRIPAASAAAQVAAPAVLA